MGNNKRGLWRRRVAAKGSKEEVCHGLGVGPSSGARNAGSGLLGLIKENKIKRKKKAVLTDRDRQQMSKTMGLWVGKKIDLGKDQGEGDGEEGRAGGDSRTKPSGSEDGKTNKERRDSIPAHGVSGCWRRRRANKIRVRWEEVARWQMERG